VKNSFINYQNLFKWLPGYHLIVDLQDIIVDASQASLKASGKQYDEVVGKNIFDVFYDNNSLATAEQLKESLNKVRLTKEKHQMGVIHYLLQGKPTYWRAENFPVLDDSGEVTHLIHTVVDVTEEELQKATLAESIKDHELLKVVTDHIPALVGYMDINGTYIFANKAYAQNLGVSLEQIIGHKRPDFTSAETAQRAVEAQRKALRGETVEYENSITDSQGRQIQLDVSYIPDKFPGTNRVRGVVTVGQDVTDLKKAIELRDEFLSIASHELRTPLTALQLQMHMTRRLMEKGELEKVSPERLNQLIGGTSRSIQRITRLIDDMLDITRINSGQMILKPESLQLRPYILEAKLLLLQIMPPNAHPPEVEVVCPDDAVVFWDRYRIEQVIINLLTNAVRYGEGKPITVAVEVKEKIHIKVSDQGMGIEAENLKRIFKRFERAVDSKAISGLGLGLYICQQIVELHNGEIIVSSVPKKGSTFEVVLPISLRDH
jgi:PAS domain S-box-containing protein